MVIPEVLQRGITAYWSMELAGREAASASQALLAKLLEAQGVDPAQVFNISKEKNTKK